MENPFDVASKRIKAEIEDASNLTSRKWEDLPINCLVLIFKKVEIPCLTLSVPFVCKSWYEASLDPACWKVLDLCTTDLRLPDSRFAEDFKCAYYVNKFSLRGFLKFLIRRSNNLATHLFTGDIYIALHNKRLLYEECPELHIISRNTVTFPPEQLRQYFLKIDATMTSNFQKGGTLKVHGFGIRDGTMASSEDIKM
ncbi:F-box/LRR-repeat protein [Carex littledalei]|uniref:F-box/LRR-repeat protein n=1 Tax=Carex littledalei TaxID=544730 RepID=A0A833R034_9POAL|nr:F-box/LRR-repeat protein [Carex littledalei]